MRSDIKLEGILFEDSSAQGKRAVHLIWGARTLRVDFGADGGVGVEAPYDQVDFSLGGNRDSLLFIKFRHQNLGSVYVHLDKETLKSLRSLNLRHASLSQILNSRSQFIRTEWLVLGLVLASLAGLIYFRGAIFGPLGELIPFRWEKAVGDKIFLREEKMVESERLARGALQAFAEELFDPKDPWREKIYFHISPQKELNAYATLGGHVFVLRGLVEGLQAPEDLLAVMAHEVSHVRERHVMRALGQGVGLFVLIQAFLGDISGLVAVLVDQGGPLLQLSYSRQLEREADRQAVAMLVAANINPMGMVNSLSQLAAEQEKLMKQMPGGEVLEKMQKVDLWSTHPEMQARIDELRQHIVAMKLEKQKWKDISKPWKELKDRVQKL